ncbi:MAG: hypothetical protein JWM10_53 [Myxococcaceae bacterium]|nr:hypothetical protein [Myxococcaceae bacterium]
MAPRLARLPLALLAASQLARCAADVDPVGTAAEPIVVCARGETVEGVDVSIYQGSRIDWNAVHASGREFAITRIGDGLGGDSTFAINWPAIRAAGMIRGAYQFYRPNRDANAQADIVCNAVGRLGPGDLPVMLDVEADNGVSPAGIRASINTWIDRVRACTGKTPMIYTAGWFWNPHVASADYGGYPLVVAAYGPRCPDLPLGWGDWTIYQYSDGEERYTPGVGVVPGIGQSCDRDRFNGSLADLRRFAQSNSPPVGYLDHTGCDALAGWSMDPDAPANVIDVHLYIGGPAGSGAPGFPVHAGIHRDDLCTAIGSCNHGFSFAPPYGLFDGADHAVFAYGIDAMGGDNPLLGTGTLHCDAPAPPIPPARGVRRHVPNPDVLAAWRWSPIDIAHLPDATLNAYPDGPDVVAAPALTRADSEDAVYVVENRVLRHVVSGESMDAWRFPWDTIRLDTVANVHANLSGVDLPARPFLALGSGPAVYLIDEAPPLWAQITRVDAPATVAAGAAATLTVALHNRGSVAWNPNEVWLVPVAPRDHDSALCDASSWRSCRQAATVGAAVAPGGDVTLTVTLRAPATAGTFRECFALRDGAVYFSDPGEMGFADDALCRSFTVTAPVTAADAGVVRSDAGVTDVGHDDAGVIAVDDVGEPATDGAVDEAPAADALTGSCGCRAPGSRPVRARGFALLGLALLARRRRR